MYHVGFGRFSPFNEILILGVFIRVKTENNNSFVVHDEESRWIFVGCIFNRIYNFSLNIIRIMCIQFILVTLILLLLFYCVFIEITNIKFCSYSYKDNVSEQSTCFIPLI